MATNKVREWREKFYEGNRDVTMASIDEALAAYEAATIERCAQIAEEPIVRLRESMQRAASANRPVVRECRQSDIETLERAAAAIRSMEEQK
jgi:hypothetical protein